MLSDSAPTEIIDRIQTLSAVSWKLRDCLLRTHGTINPEIVRLEDAVHRLDQSLRELKQAAGAAG